MPVQKKNSLSIGLPSGVYGKSDDRSATKESFQMDNPFYGLHGLYKSNVKRLSLGSCKETANTKANQILEEFAQLSIGEIKAYKEEYKIRNNETYLKTVKPEITISPIEHKLVQTNNKQLTVNYVISSIKQEHIRDNLAAATIKTYNTPYNRIAKIFGNHSPEFLTIENISKHMAVLISKGKKRAAQQLKNGYKRLLKHGSQQGYFDFNLNDLNKLKSIKVKVKRSRLEYKVFIKVQANKSQPKIHKLFNDLCLVLNARPIEVSTMRKERGQDYEQRVKKYNDGKFTNSEVKTFKDIIKNLPYSYIDKDAQVFRIFETKKGTFRNVPFSHKIGENIKSAGEILKELEEYITIESDFVFSYQKGRGRTKAGVPISPKAAADNFKKQIAKLNLTWASGTPPSLYELRSLAARLSEKYNGRDGERLTQETKTGTIDDEIENAQCASKGVRSSLGHSPKSKITETYLAPRTSFAEIE